MGALVALGVAASALLVAPAAQAADAVHPTVTALSVTPSAVTAPGSTTVQLRVTGPERPTYAQVTFVEPSGRARVVQLPMVDAGPGEYSGTVSYPIKDGVENGHWKVLWVYLPTSVTTQVCDTAWQKDYCTSSKDFSSAGIDVSGSLWDEAAPVVDSITPPASPVRPGQGYPIVWHATDAHPLASLSMRFQNPAPEARGNELAVSVTDAAALAAGRVTAVLPGTAYDGSYVLTSLIIRDSVGNVATYRPDGTVLLSIGTKQPRTHGLTFSAIAVPVTGSTQDVKPPVLTSFVPNRRSVVAQDSVRFSYVSTDASVPYTGAWLELVWPSGATGTVPAPAPVPATGAIDVNLAEVGVYKVSKVILSDNRDNAIEYRRDGTTYNLLTKVTGHHTIDLAASDITVTPLLRDAVATPHAHGATVLWEHPWNEGPNVTSYRVVASPGGAVVTVPAGAGGPRTATFTGLQNAVKYTFTVTVQSTFGPGPSASATTTPLFSTNVWGAGDVNGDRRNDLFAGLALAHGDKVFRLYRGTNGPGFGGGTTTMTAPSTTRGFPGATLWGEATFLTVDARSNLTIQRINKSGGLEWRGAIGAGWGVRFLDAHADFTGDGVADAVAVREDGSAYLYRGLRDNYGYTKGTRIATGWSTMQTVFAATDVTGDRRADLLGVDKGGVLWIFPGTGQGTFSPKRKVSAGWGGLGALFSARDVSGDGRVDLGAVTMDGTLRVYKGRGNGTFSSAVSVSQGWAPYL
jgi:hypothetical protein